ncbi:MAG: threonine synthase [Alphaproteobacteria bacterium]
MRYVSTRGEAPTVDFEDVLLTGLAGDGGLYLPESWPRLDPAELRAMRGLSYSELAARVMWPFVEGAIAETEFDELVRDTYAKFDHPAVAPLKQLGSNLWLLELFHGPTLAFKDYALQLLGRLFDHILERRGERVTVVGATSGDTGSAAIEACRDRDAIDVFILHPRGRISEVQRRQMTTVKAPNVHNIALEGTFDDCQDVVKALFGDAAFRDEVRLSAVNSINWARIMAQTAYYVAAAVALGAPDRPVRFAVPTGNFGNVYAAYGARAMGLPVDRLIAGSNRNDILARFFESGVMALGPVEPSLSPSMDIQISSNFERLLFDLYDRGGAAVAAAMVEFRETGRLDVGRARWRRAREIFIGCRVDDEATLAMIKRVYETCGALVDPHTAVGLVAAEDRDEDTTTPLVALACAHPAKFPLAVERATGVVPALPRRLADLMEREERISVLERDVAAVQAFVRGRIRAEQAA